MPSLSATVVRHHRPSPSLLSSAATVFRCRHLCCSHHHQSPVSTISCRLLSSFPVIVRRLILQAVVIRCRCRPPPSSSAVTVVVCRHGLPPLQPSSPLSCLRRLSPPSSLPHCRPPANLTCLCHPLPTVAAAVVSSAVPFS
jgi:hypothetical protein